jgi:hypothetical protein
VVIDSSIWVVACTLLGLLRPALLPALFLLVALALPLLTGLPVLVVHEMPLLAAEISANRVPK